MGMIDSWKAKHRAALRVRKTDLAGHPRSWTRSKTEDNLWQLIYSRAAAGIQSGCVCF